MKQIRMKIRGCRGETIAEVLVALLVSTLALMILAGMISATSRIVIGSKDKMDDYYKANTGLETFAGASKAENPIVLKITAAEAVHTVTIPAERIEYNENKELKETVTAYRYIAASSGESGGTPEDGNGG